MSDVSTNNRPNGWKREILQDLVTSVRESAKINANETYELWSVPSFAEGAPEIVLGGSIGSGKLRVQPNDVLISKINPRINRVWIVGEQASGLEQVSSTEWLVGRVDDLERILPQYLKWYATAPQFREWISSTTQGVTGSHTRAKANQILAQEVPVPSLAEQKKIVEILEEQLSRLDAALASVCTVRDKTSKLRRSLLHAAFTGALTGHDPSLGTPPAVWVETEISEVAHINYGYTESATRDSVGPKFLRITDVQDGRVSWSEVPYCIISEKDEEKHRLASGDIVFARTGATTGKSFLVVNPPNAVCASYLIRLRPMDDKVLPEFLNAYFQSDTYWNQIRIGTTGTAQGGFNASKLAKLVVVLPSLVEQEKILEILEEQLSRLDTSFAIIYAVEKRAAALRRSLLHAAFTGKLTERWREGSHV